MPDTDKVSLPLFAALALKVYHARPQYLAMLYRELPADAEDPDTWLSEAVTTWPEMFEAPAQVKTEPDVTTAEMTAATPTPEEDDAALHDRVAQGKYFVKFGTPAGTAHLAAHGLKPGEILKSGETMTADEKAKTDAADKIKAETKGARNPWSREWVGTIDARAKEQSRIIRTMGSKFATELARSAGAIK